MKRETIGTYTVKDGKEIIKREYYRQGLVYKNFEAFENNPDEVCYIPELSDSKYSRTDLLELVNGNEEVATEMFEALDWQHPGSLLEDWEINGEVMKCECCGKYFFTFQEDDYNGVCPYCKHMNEL